MVLDNMLRDGRVLDPQDDNDRAVADLNESLVADDRVDVVLLPVRDGVSLARKRGPESSRGGAAGRRNM
jgi:caffeoyl-CoA O-methyltransferase